MHFMDVNKQKSVCISNIVNLTKLILTVFICFTLLKPQKSDLRNCYFVKKTSCNITNRVPIFLWSQLILWHRSYVMYWYRKSVVVLIDILQFNRGATSITPSCFLYQWRILGLCHNILTLTLKRVYFKS